MIELVAFFLLAVALDYADVLRHSARERRQLVSVGAWSAVVEVLGWVPVWFAITEQRPDWAVAAVFGSAVGSVIATSRQRTSD